MVFSTTLLYKSNSDKINLLWMRKPSKRVLEMEYKNIPHTNEGKVNFLHWLITLIERDQITQLVTIARDHPIFKYHKDDKQLINISPTNRGIQGILGDKLETNFTQMGKRGYLCAPFWILALLHQDLSDIITMPRLPDEFLKEILDFAYEKVSKINF